MLVKQTYPYLFLGLVLWLYAGSMWGQGIQIQGQITDSESGDPVAHAHVFVVNSHAGTLSDEDGKFLLEGVPPGMGQLVVSHVSYQQVNLSLSYREKGTYTHNIRLRPTAYELEAVTLIAKMKGKHKRAYQRFVRAFLGSSPNAGKCEVVNPEVLSYEFTDDAALVVKARDLIEIRNEALGYRLFVLLDRFRLREKEISYEGKPFFQALEPTDEKQVERWRQRRESTYLGSPRHFFRSLLKGESQEEGFRVFQAQLHAQKNEFISGSPVNPRALWVDGQHIGQKYLKLPEFVKVVYTKQLTSKSSIEIH